MPIDNRNKQKEFVLWFTGFPSSGKTAIANKVYKILKEKGLKLARIDGDVFRRQFCSDLGFSKKDRDENIGRAGDVIKILSEDEVSIIASFVSPYKKQREELRKNLKNFIEIFVNTPLTVCAKRDKKGLYQKAYSGKIKNFTGVNDPYEIPQNPEIELKTENLSVENAAQKVIAYLRKNKYI